MSKAQRLALIVAGGTGGHIFPGLSVASELKARGWQVQWAGNPQAMEGRLVPAHGVEMNTLVFSGFRGKGIVQQVFMPLKLLRAFWTSVQILRRTKPAVVLGMGGYVAFPLGMMASLLNIPLVVHEQNSVAGLTNKVLAKLADRNLVAFPYALPNSNWVGNPVREMIYSQSKPEVRFAERSGSLKLLVLVRYRSSPLRLSQAWNTRTLVLLLSALLFFFTRTDRYLVASGAITVMALTCFNLIGDGFLLIVPRMVDTLLGLEYDAGCWLGRVVYERLQSTTSTSRSRILFQLEFVGLARVGSSPLKTLRDNIPRYQYLREDLAPTTRFTTYD